MGPHTRFTRPPVPLLSYATTHVYKKKRGGAHPRKVISHVLPTSNLVTAKANIGSAAQPEGRERKYRKKDQTLMKKSCEQINNNNNNKVKADAFI